MMRRITLIILCIVMATEVGQCQVYKPVLEGTEFDLYCPGEGNSSESDSRFTTLSKDGNIIKNWTGQVTYHVNSAQLIDSGIYSCNHSGAINRTVVAVGNKPEKPPSGVCFESPNATILCKAGPVENNGRDVTVCLTASKQISKRSYIEANNCADGPGPVTIVCNADTFEFLILNLNTTVRNGFGESTKTTKLYLVNYVIPDPPQNVLLVATSTETFNASFEIPTTWMTSSIMYYSYQYRQEMENGSQMYQHFDNVNEGPATAPGIPLVEFHPKGVQKRAYSLICLSVRIRYGISTSTWGNYSQPTCRHTKMAAPSQSPRGFTKTEYQHKDTPAFRKVIFKWKPPEKQYHNGIIDHYLLTLDIVGNRTMPVTNILSKNINANETTYTVDDIESYRNITATIRAFTEAGASPGYVINLPATLQPIDGVSLLSRLEIPVVFTVIVIIMIGVIGCSRSIHSKLRRGHLPEPHLFPQCTIRYLLSTKSPASPQKEIFDDLKIRSTVNIPDVESTKLQLLTTTRSSAKDSAVSRDIISSREVSSGRSCCREEAREEAKVHDSLNESNAPPPIEGDGLQNLSTDKGEKEIYSSDNRLTESNVSGNVPNKTGYVPGDVPYFRFATCNGDKHGPMNPDLRVPNTNVLHTTPLNRRNPVTSDNEVENVFVDNTTMTNYENTTKQPDGNVLYGSQLQQREDSFTSPYATKSFENPLYDNRHCAEQPRPNQPYVNHPCASQSYS